MKLESSAENAIVSAVESLGFYCFEIKYFTAGGKTILRVFADSDSGITMDDCANISHKLSDVLDEIDFGQDEYTLEVSSPGLDRPLTTPRDYRRFLGKDVQVRFKDDTDKQCKQTGSVSSVTDETLVLVCGGEEFVFPFESLISGKLVF